MLTTSIVPISSATTKGIRCEQLLLWTTLGDDVVYQLFVPDPGVLKN